MDDLFVVFVESYLIYIWFKEMWRNYFEVVLWTELYFKSKKLVGFIE